MLAYPENQVVKKFGETVIAFTDSLSDEEEKKRLNKAWETLHESITLNYPIFESLKEYEELVRYILACDVEQVESWRDIVKRISQGS